MSADKEPTERLYFQNSHLLQFQAQVLSCKPQDKQWQAILDRTAFYPTGGGQPNDLGRLGDAHVLDCVEIDDQIIHILDQPINGEVVGEIDSDRRRDHLQQHTGQHILSQAFIQVAGAETRGFHLGAESSTIDLALENPTAEIIASAEDLANSIVFDDRPVKIHLTTPADLADPAERGDFPLRKESEREGCLRIIEIEKFDFSPCGGTHAHRTGEVGLILVRGFERAKRMCRLEFLCGRRALLDYRIAQSSAQATATLFSATRDTAPGLVARLQQEQKALQKRVRELLELALEAEAHHLYETAKINAGGIHIVQINFSNRPAEELKVLAHRIIAKGGAIALLSAGGEATRLVFARSQGLAIDCGQLMNSFCQRFGGRGGGKADLAQGGVVKDSPYQAALSELAASL